MCRIISETYMTSNKLPLNWPANKRMAIIGDLPSKEDTRLGHLFTGHSGLHLDKLLDISKCPQRRDLFLGNISSDWAFDMAWNGPQIQNGMMNLKQQMMTLQPNIVVLLGNLPLKAARDPDNNHPLIPKLFRFKVSTWRGSLFVCDKPSSPFFGLKCIATYHPSYIVRDYSANPLAIFDLKRANQESGFPTLHLPHRNLITTITADDIIRRLVDIRASRSLVALDIEGGLGDMSCISFAVSPYEAFIVPFYDRMGHYKWKGDPAGPRIWRELARLLEDEAVPKVLQNCLYDMFVLEYGYGIRVKGVRHDTMLSGWEIYSQLEKGLDVQTSVYTREPYYKSEYKSWDTESFYRYCCKDSCVTYEISQVHQEILSPHEGLPVNENGIRAKQLEHYQSNVANLSPLLYMELTGIRYDTDKAAARRTDLLRQYYEAQARLDLLSGYRFKWENKQEIFTTAKNLFGLARKLEDIVDWPSLQANHKKGPENKRYGPAITRLIELVNAPSPTLATIGEIEDICEVALNVDSDDFETYLYEQLKLPIQYNENEKGEKVPTTDYEALLRLSKECITHPYKYSGVAGESVKLAIEIRSILRRAAMLEIYADRDGRIRCGYNIVGSYTGRVTSYKSPTGSGYNLQTIPNYTNRAEAPGGVLGDRDLFLADNGYWFFQCDLKGADGWTVAAYSAMLGDSTMLDDYNAGLKPHNIMALKLRGVSANYDDREELKYLCHPSRFDKNAWDVFACKRVFHGGNYLEGDPAIAKNILTDSEGKLWMSPAECGQLKRVMFHRYRGTLSYHRYIEDKIKKCGGIPYLVAASGQRCYFFDRPQEILTKAVALEPQANTTYATNKAMSRLWNDPENRLTENYDAGERHGLARANMGRVLPLRIMPLHQVHDALCGQFRKSDTSWATDKIKSYFNNPITIAGISLVIPFDGGYGRSWGETDEGKI